MKALNKLSALFFISTVYIFSQQAVADNLFTSMDDPSKAEKSREGEASAGYMSQSGNTKSSSLNAKANMTWYQSQMAYSLWGNAANTSSKDDRSSETYQFGGRTRYNMTDHDYLFGQASWLSDRLNGYDSRSVLNAGYGRQILNGPVHSLRIEGGPGVRYDDYREGGHDVQPLAYAGLGYQWQFSDNTQFIQGLSVLGSDRTTLNSESGLRVSMNEHFALKLAYNVVWNQNPPASAPRKTDTKTTISLAYAL